MGACGVGVGRSEMAAIWATGELWLRVPESVRFIVDGALPFGVTAKDLTLHIIGKFGADGGLYQSIEFSGTTFATMSMDSRAVIPNMMAEFGVKCAYIPPDEALYEWLAPRLMKRLKTKDSNLQSLIFNLQSRAVFPDPDATYLATHRIDATTLEPLVACPHSPDNVKPISHVKGTRVQQAFIGTCTNGRLEDLAAAAEIVRGKRIARGMRLIVIPASSEVMLDAVKAGYVQTLLEAGAVFNTPGCGPCMGNHMGVPAPGEVTISSANRNFRGRMGTRDAETYVSSPAVVAASALAGYIADPRDII
jgi:3-isopropylmalate/(R)-2-methylmalate dehydratase large subunit